MRFVCFSGMQMLETGDVDVKRVMLTATSAATMASTAECAKAAAMKTDAFANRRNEALVPILPKVTNICNYKYF
jgi:hypothetical protein